MNREPRTVSREPCTVHRAPCTLTLEPTRIVSVRRHRRLAQFDTYEFNTRDT